MANTFKSFGNNNLGTTATTIYTAGATSLGNTIIGLSVANVSTSTVNVDVTMNKGATVLYLVKNAPVPVGGSLVVIGGDQKLVAEANNYIQVKSSAATSIDAIVSVLEITP